MLSRFYPNWCVTEGRTEHMTVSRAIFVPVTGSPSKYYYNVWYEKPEWYGYPTVKKMEEVKEMFTRFDRIHERHGHPNRRMDGRTPHDGIGKA